jgi:hypothetical protein
VKVIKKGVNSVDQVVAEVLAVPANTLGVLHLLTAKAANEIKDHNLLFEQVRRIMINGDIEQIAIAPHLCTYRQTGASLPSPVLALRC